MSVDPEAKSTKERCIRVAAIAIVTQDGGANICVEVRRDYVRKHESGERTTLKGPDIPRRIAGLMNM